VEPGRSFYPDEETHPLRRSVAVRFGGFESCGRSGAGDWRGWQDPGGTGSGTIIASTCGGHGKNARKHLVAVEEGATDFDCADARGGVEDLLTAAGLSRATRRRRAADRVTDHHRLRSRWPHVGPRTPG